MSRYVHEIMNPELFFLRPSDSVGDALLGILSLSITAAPVVDEEHRPVGVVSLRDLVGTGGPAVGDRMSAPVATAARDDAIEDAGRELARSDRHRLVVVDDDGRAVGVVSALDLLRASLDVPPRHPAAFPHLDAAGVSWSDPFELTLDALEAAPDGQGLFVLFHDEVGKVSLPVWAESSHNVRTRLTELVGAPRAQDPWLREILTRDATHLRVRAAALVDAEKQAQALELARRNIRSAAGFPAPG